MRAAFVLLMVALPTQAQNTIECQGVLPGWSLSIDGTEASLTTDEDKELQVLDQTQAEGRDWPRALTLVGGTNTAILIIEHEMCQINEATQPFQAQVLTQIGTVPVLLTGCCTVQE